MDPNVVEFILFHLLPGLGAIIFARKIADLNARLFPSLSLIERIAILVTQVIIGILWIALGLRWLILR